MRLGRSTLREMMWVAGFKSCQYDNIGAGIGRTMRLIKTNFRRMGRKQ